MFDFRLRVFDTVAKRLSFTKAANELNITQPAVTKHIQEIERQLNTALFDRNGTKIKLTVAGETLLKYTEQLFSIYRELEFEINYLNQEHKGLLRIGASTTIAQYLLSPILAKFHEKFKEIKISLTINNTEVIEQLLLNKEIDLGLIEGYSKNRQFQYHKLIKDEIVLVTKANHPLSKRNALKIEELKTLPLILREPGSGTLETILFALKKVNLSLSDLKVEMQLGNTESIKSYLLHSSSFAFMSVHAVLQELRNKSLSVIDVKNLQIERYFQFIQLQGSHAALANLFLNFAVRYNKKL
ncbi:LysR family transcriptional regulator [Pedobacter rhizosphaerae]|uniref:DNA-binding transcriptional regulator, LysR family n=1 Tax=Pedobacter rhizosphaerae TaxID=390241 RepID=A0A1H9L6H1_9SPHI|nr:LysR family transcriptional regulator [Pedobacter rhizosphaerae]SER07016.1 DNA-binding transcriptional regulator, LysR family [Pedobacter rhizosphaerae]